MKTLKAFWHWVDNEKPSEITWKHLEPLSVVADRALHMALELVDERRWGGDADGHESLDTLRDQWPAIRDLSLAICQAIERMHEQVEPSETMNVLREMYPEPKATLPPCPACNRSPCEGSHVSCDPLKAEPLTVRGRVGGWHFDDDTRHLIVYTAVCREGVDRLRGLSPRAITLRGKDRDYTSDVLPLLREVLVPMVVCGTLFSAPEGATLPSDW